MGAVLVWSLVSGAGDAHGNECERVRAESCGYYQRVVAKSVEDFRAAVAVCVESSRDTTDKNGLDVGAGLVHGPGAMPAGRLLGASSARPTQ